MDARSIFVGAKAVTKRWTRQRKAEERRQSNVAHRKDMFLTAKWTARAAAFAEMRDAYMKASSNNTLPAHARQIMYAARGPIQNMTGKVLKDQYFCQTLLPDYLEENPEETSDWDVVFDARGHLTEPHTERVVPLGTLSVRDYLDGTCGDSLERADGETDPAACLTVQTCGPWRRYGAILFVEKEGFMPLFERVRLAERFDVAIMSTKGQSVTASRRLVDHLCHQYDIPLLVLHDFDKAGFSIVGSFRRDTRRYSYKNDITVVDLGLRLADVDANGLAPEAVHHGTSDPSDNLRENGATPKEIEYLRGPRRRGPYVGQRVELNAFTSGDFIAWIQRKLVEQGVTKVVPDDNDLNRAYRLAVEQNILRAQFRAVEAQAREQAAAIAVPANIRERVDRLLTERPELPWDQAVAMVAVESSPAA